MPFVAERQFIIATRETGYRTAASAIAELVDNALQAQAKSVQIRTRIVVDSDGGNVVEIAVLDDGYGMAGETLTRALRFGGTDRFDDRAGLGRFGMGLPNSSVSQARRVDVYSWRRPKQVVHSYLDVDEIAAGVLTDVAAIQSSSPPAWVASRLPRSGTVVIWSKCDRISAKRLESFRERLRIALGRAFRYFLWSGTQILVDGEPTIAIDPLLCRLAENPKVCASEVGQPLVYEVASPRVAGSSSKILVRFSQLPIRQWSDLATEEKRRLGISKGAGVSVVRAGREIAYGWHFMGQKRKENYDDWWRCEVRFEPELDELFGVTHSKQGIRPTSELEAVLSPDLERIAHDLNRRVRNEFTKLKEATPKSAADLAKAKDRFLTPLRRGVPLAAKGRHGVEYRVQSRTLSAERFFASKVANGRVTVTINKSHPFFEVYSGGNGSNADVRFAIDSLLLAMARAEQTVKKSEQREALRKCFLAWSDNLATFLRR